MSTLFHITDGGITSKLIKYLMNIIEKRSFNDKAMVSSNSFPELLHDSNILLLGCQMSQQNSQHCNLTFGTIMSTMFP